MLWSFPQRECMWNVIIRKANGVQSFFLCMLNLFLVVYCFDKRVTLSFTWFILVYKICTTSMYFIDCSTCTSDSMMLNMYTFTVILTRLDGWLQPLYSISHLQKSYTIYLHSIWRGIINQYPICSITVFARIKLSFTWSRCFDVI